MFSALHPNLPAQTPALQARFRAARPFRHLVIDDFLDQAFAAALLDQFPPFGHGSAVADDGSLGLKSTVERIRGLGPAWTRLDDLVRSRPFLELVGSLTGIPDLLYDPWYFGGGTHENRHGQDLDAHVDFNRHPVERWHRRLNLIVYLNPRWQADWGGALELHSDPRSDDDQVTSIEPLYNRAVIFETTEWSWHAFPPIQLPEPERHLSRKSIALYFYTKDRPAEELADTHSTIYVDRPLPDRFQAGHTLTDDDVQALRDLLSRRDAHNQRLYREVGTLTGRLDQAHQAMGGGPLGRLTYFAQRALARLRRR